MGGRENKVLGKTAAILGVGRMGTAIAWAMDKLGYRVVGMDSNPGASDNIPVRVNNMPDPKNEFFIVEDLSDIEKALTHANADIAISSLPYHQTEQVGLWCIDNGVRYCDLGGRVDVSEKINKRAAENATAPVMTDLGLAPGLVNILAEQGCRQIHSPPISVKMMVGGIPMTQFNPPFNYTLTWSTDGLINEYRDDCKVLEDGEIKIVKGMSGLEDVYSNYMQEDLEAFYTSGGASHSIESMKSRGVQNCSYKTLRYPGHADVLKLLIRDCNLSDNELERIIISKCPKGADDLVIIKVVVDAGKVSWNQEVLIRYGQYHQGFSAMQQATAFPIAAVASLMGQGLLDDRKVERRGYYERLPHALTYGDIPFDKFKEQLKLLGMEV